MDQTEEVAQLEKQILSDYMTFRRASDTIEVNKMSFNETKIQTSESSLYKALTKATMLLLSHRTHLNPAILSPKLYTLSRPSKPLQILSQFTMFLIKLTTKCKLLTYAYLPISTYCRRCCNNQRQGYLK